MGEKSVFKLLSIMKYIYQIKWLLKIPTKFSFYLKNTDLGSYTEILFYIYDHG